MFLLRRPSRQFIEDYLARQARLPFSYAHAGASAGPAPAGFVLSEVRVELGKGVEAYQRACAGLRDWRQFQLGWVEICWPETPLEAGRTVAILAHAFGLWSLNACRIVEPIDEHNAEMSSFGFVYGTLPDHVAAGEERFVIEWDHRDDRVWYKIRAFSRPNHLLSRAGAPLMRRLQERFRRDSSAAMIGQCVRH